MQQTAVLLIEDHATTRLLARQALSEAGYRVHEARDGETALALMREHQPLLVLQDLVLPDCDGFELALRLRGLAEGVDVRVLALSGLLSRADAARLWATGFDDVLMKPLDPSRLLACVEYHREAVRRDVRAPAREPLELTSPSVASLLSIPPRDAILQSALVAAELTVLRTICSAVLAQGDVEGAVVTALSTCFDAVHSSLGALYLSERHDHLRMRPLGAFTPADVEQLATFFGQEPWLREQLASGTPRMLAATHAEGPEAAILSAAKAASGIVAPLVHGETPLGALFVVMREGGYETELDQRWAFVLRIARQVADALALAHAFRGREVAEREAEQQRRLSREQAVAFRSIVEGAPDEIVHLDASGKVRFANRAAVLARGASGSDESWLEGHEPEDRARLDAALRAVMGGGAGATVELSRLGPDGSITFAESHFGPVRIYGQIGGAVVVQRDTTARKAADADLLLDQRLPSIGTLAAGVAHEINNPLASVIANLDLAQHEVQGVLARAGVGASSELLEELRDARTAAERVRAIVRDLRSFSRLDETRVAVDVEAVAEAAVRLAGHEIRQRARLVRAYAPVPSVETNEAMLGQLVLHLLVNAAQALDPSRADCNELRIELARRDGGVLLALEHRGAASIKTPSGGPGIPLARTRPYGLHRGFARLACVRLATAIGGALSMQPTKDGGMRAELVLAGSPADAPSL